MHDIAKPVSTELKVRSGRGAWRLAIGGLLALVILLVGIKGLQISKMMAAAKAMTPPPQAVSSAEVREENWAPVLSAIGSVSAVQGAIIAAELGGVVSEVKFENGGVAKKGDVIMKLDASQEEALLRSAEAEAELSRTDLERTQGLASQKVVSKAELDAADSKFRRLTAIVDQMRSNIRKKTLVAPFDGQLGIRQVNVGQMINPGQQVVALTSVCRLCVAAATFSAIIPGLGSPRPKRCRPWPRFPWKVNRGELDGRYGYAKCLCAGDAG